MEENKIIVENNKRLTNNILTKFEYVHIINTRAQQIGCDFSYRKNPVIFIRLADLDKNRIDDPIYIATEEFKQNKIPFIIKRETGDNRIEFWHLIKDNMIYLNE